MKTIKDIRTRNEATLEDSAATIMHLRREMEREVLRFQTAIGAVMSENDGDTERAAEIIEMSAGCAWQDLAKEMGLE